MKNTAIDDLLNCTSLKIMSQTCLMLLGTVVAFASCTTTVLSKSDAAKQIEKMLEKGQSKCVITLKKDDCLFSDNSDHNQYMAAVANYGHDYVKFNIVTECGMMHDQPYVKSFQVLDKAKPYLVGENNSTAANMQFGKHVVTVISMTEPAANAEGIIVCRVTYSDALTLNQFGKDIGIADAPSSAATHSVQFVKMQDGWRIDERYRE